MTFVFDPFSGSFNKQSECCSSALVLAGNTQIIWSCSKTSFSSINFSFEVSDNALSLMRIFNMKIALIADVARDQIYARSGIGPDFTIIANTSATDIQLSVTNNESFDLNFKFSEL
jgi:hypothetical protein